VEITTTTWPNGNFTSNHWIEFVTSSLSGYSPANEWTPQRTNAQPGTQSAVWTLPTGPQTNRLFHLRSWYDCNEDLAASTNKPIRAVHVGVANTELLALKESSSGRSVCDTTWASEPVSTNNTLYILQTNNTSVNVSLALGYAPFSAPSDRMRFLIKRTGGGVVPGCWNVTDGDFGTNPVSLTWTQPASGPVYRSFDMIAWYDCNNNGVLNGHEPRLSHVALLVNDVSGSLATHASRAQDLGREDRKLMLMSGRV
jgi:hypothetical protein